MKIVKLIHFKRVQYVSYQRYCKFQFTSNRESRVGIRPRAKIASKNSCSTAGKKIEQRIILWCENKGVFSKFSDNPQNSFAINMSCLVRYAEMG